MYIYKERERFYFKFESSLTSTRNTLAQLITRIDKLEAKKSGKIKIDNIGYQKS